MQIKHCAELNLKKSYTVCLNVSLKMPKKGLWLWLIKHQLGGKRPSIGIVLSDAKKVKSFWDWVMRWLSISNIAQISTKGLLSKLQVTFNQIHSWFLQLPKTYSNLPNFIGFTHFARIWWQTFKSYDNQLSHFGLLE